MARQADSHKNGRRGHGLLPPKWHANSRVGRINLQTGLFGYEVGEIKVGWGRAVVERASRVKRRDPTNKFEGHTSDLLSLAPLPPCTGSTHIYQAQV
jgi:hypothetical protein